MSHTVPPSVTDEVANVSLLPGVGLCAAIALVSLELGRFPSLVAFGLSALSLAVLFGMILGNTVFPAAAAACGPGLQVSQRTLLRAGIVLYGFRLTFADVAQIGTGGLVVDAVMISSTFALAMWLGTRVLKLDRTDVILIGAGASICGAAAVLATGSVVKARADQVTVAVATVVLFGTIAMFSYPVLHPLLAHYFASDPGSFGIYVGSTVHEVAQAVAAGSMFDAATANMALIAKLGRVAMLGPFLLLLSAWFARKAPETAGSQRLVVPWFAVGFLATAALNSFISIPPVMLQGLHYAGTLFLGMAMAGLGLGAQVGIMRRAGAKPIVLAAALAAWLLTGGLLINLSLSALR